jgi:hypothetical protein
MPEKTILVLGGPKSGKTHYGAQLTVRLSKKLGDLKYYEQPENLSLFQETITCLSRGRLAPHTPVSVSKDIVLPIELPNGDRARVVWPDFGGEQIDRILEQRVTPIKWKERATIADGWLLMIRPELFRSARDLIHRPLSDFVPETSDKAPPALMMPEASIVELLQILLFLRRSSRESKILHPRLTVAISCWDESDTSDFQNPSLYFSTLTPMLSNFVLGTWDKAQLNVIGVSALGKTLDANQDDEDFIDQGAHRQGFVILPDGKKIEDLTWPLLSLLSQS